MLAARTGVRRVVKLLLNAGANVNDVNWNGDPALICAVRKGCDNCADELIAGGADVNIINREGNTALLYAAEVVDEETLELLIKSGADVNIRGRHRKTALVEVAEQGNSQCLEYLLKAGADVTIPGKYMKNALVEAVGKGHYVYRAKRSALTHAVLAKDLKSIEKLIEAGANVNLRDEKGCTALISAAQNGVEDCLEQLIDSGADVNSSDDNGNTALIAAARNNYEACMKSLIDAGADVNKMEMYGSSALRYSVKNLSMNCIDLLLKSGADVNYSSDENEPLLISLAKSSNPKDLEVISKLTKAGADVNITNMCGNTPLMEAIRAGTYLNRSITPSSVAICKQVDTVKLLLREGADVNLRNHRRTSALLLAANHNDIAILKMLIEAGADVNVTDFKNRSALIDCAMAGLSQHSKLLIEAGANVNFSCKETVALHHFAYRNDFARVQQLLRAGAHVNKSELNTVRYYINCKDERRSKQNMGKLLFAAGDHVGVPDYGGSRRRSDYFMATSYRFPNFMVDVPEYLRKLEEEELNLMSMCRAAVRHYMLEASNLNLFMRVPTLEIPCVLMDYLLYDMSVEKDYDPYEDDNIGDDDDNNSHSDDDDSSDDGNTDNSDSSCEAQYYSSHSGDDSLGPDYDPFRSDDDY